jgi:ribosomal protein L37AE/L43A
MTDSTPRRLRCRRCARCTRLRVRGTIETWQCTNCGYHNAVDAGQERTVEVEDADRTAHRPADYGFE